MDYVTFSYKGGEEIMRMYFLKFKDAGGMLPKDTEYGSKFEFCIHNNIIGVSSKITDDTLRLLREIKKGDFFWINECGQYYIAYATGTIATAGADYNKYDIEYYIKCKYYQIGSELPDNLSFCKDLLETSEVIKEVEYNNVLFAFAEKLISEDGREMTEPNNKKFLSSKKSKIIAVSVCVLLVIVGFFAVKGVQYMMVKSQATSLPGELSGKTYASCYVTEYSDYYEIIIFDEEGKKYRTMETDNQYLNEVCYANAEISDWKEVKFGVDFLSGDIYWNTNSKFNYNKELGDITVGSENYMLMTDVNCKIISDMCYSLLYYQYTQAYNESYSENRGAVDTMIEQISSYDFIDTESMKSDIYMNRSLASLESQSMYGSSVLELIDTCTSNLVYERCEYSGSNVYTFVYSCDYAPNKADLPNYYVKGELQIHYNFKSGIAGISGSVVDGMQTYAILKAFS